MESDISNNRNNAVLFFRSRHCGTVGPQSGKKKKEEEEADAQELK